MMRKAWSDFEQVLSSTGPHGARHVHPDELVAIVDHKKSGRIDACGGIDPLGVCIAYAQESLVYNDHGDIIAVDPSTYIATPRERRVNVFARAYRRDAKLWMHKTLADIVVAAATYLYQTQQWKTVVYDGLRTVDGAFGLYNAATDQDLSDGLLALPGKSAHNKGLAVDSMMMDANGKEVDMGGHFDHLDMATNMRFYNGDKISEVAKKNRLIREAAFLRAAFTQELLIAPLRSEFWDDRPPEDRSDLWRVLDSTARVMGVTLERNKEWGGWSYADFLEHWQTVFRGREAELEKTIGVKMPPAEEKFEFYHGNYHPIYDRELRASGKHLTD
jgi:D-alanyl-D-alanine dipeptidase